MTMQFISTIENCKNHKNERRTAVTQLVPSIAPTDYTHWSCKLHTVATVPLVTVGILEELWWMLGRRSPATIESGTASQFASLPYGCSSDRKNAPGSRRTRCAR